MYYSRPSNSLSEKGCEILWEHFCETISQIYIPLTNSIPETRIQLEDLFSEIFVLWQHFLAFYPYLQPRSLSGLKYINLTSTTAKIIFLFLTNWETINNQSSCSFMDLYLDDNVFLMTLNNIYYNRDWDWFEWILLLLWKSKLHQSNKKCDWLGLGDSVPSHDVLPIWCWGGWIINPDNGTYTKHPS